MHKKLTEQLGGLLEKTQCVHDLLEAQESVLLSTNKELQGATATASSFATQNSPALTATSGTTTPNTLTSSVPSLSSSHSMHSMMMPDVPPGMDDIADVGNPLLNMWRQLTKEQINWVQEALKRQAIQKQREDLIDEFVRNIPDTFWWINLPCLLLLAREPRNFPNKHLSCSLSSFSCMK